MNFLTLLILSYILGSIPFGLLLTRLAGLGDIRSIGSGNIGATNVLRTGRKGLALSTLLLDAAKGFAAVFIAQYAYPEMAQFAGLAALIGHMHPVWLRFKGGKGVSTALGVLLAFSWPVALCVLSIWLVTAYLSRYSSLSAMTATALSPAVAFLLGNRELVWLLTVMTVLIFIKHRNNIVRLIRRTEPKIGQNKTDEA